LSKLILYNLKLTPSTNKRNINNVENVELFI